MQELLGYSASYGFPMVISAYLLIRLEQKLERLTESICLLRLSLSEARD